MLNVLKLRCDSLGNGFAGAAASYWQCLADCAWELEEHWDMGRPCMASFENEDLPHIVCLFKDCSASTVVSSDPPFQGVSLSHFLLVKCLL